MAQGAEAFASAPLSLEYTHCCDRPAGAYVEARTYNREFRPGPPATTLAIDDGNNAVHRSEVGIMYKRNHGKLFSLAATVFATGLMAQGATAMVTEEHEKEGAVSSASIEGAGHEGPRGEIVLQHDGEDRTEITANLGGRVGPLPTGEAESSR